VKRFTIRSCRRIDRCEFSATATYGYDKEIKERPAIAGVAIEPNSRPPSV
jgi:hypothetical protein